MDVGTIKMTNSGRDLKISPERLQQSYDFCKSVASNEARNFYWSFRLLPKARRQSMCALYAFMRYTDDLADEPRPAADRSLALDRWQIQLNQFLDGNPIENSAWEGFPALVETVRIHNIPRKYLIAVIDGMRMDLNSVRIQTESEFDRYCWHVASVVGLCCLHIWGFESNDGQAELLAEKLGIAFQRTNILRDIAEDYSNNRIYLPASLMQKYGVEMHELGLPTSTESLKNLVKDQVAIARSEYQSAGELQSLVSSEGRPMLRAISRIYESVLNQVQYQKYDVLVDRARVPKWRKIAIMTFAMFG